MAHHLDVLLPLLEKGSTDRVQLTTEAPAPPVLVAALGPKMLELAGSRTDGTITWMVGPRTTSPCA